MNENEPKNPASIEEAVPSPDENLIKQLDEMKRTTISKDEYLRVIKINETLTNQLAKGGTPEPIKPEVVPDLKEEAKEILNSRGITNLDYIKKSLKFRDDAISQGHKDPWLATSDKVAPTQEEIDGVERVATALKECVENSGDDPEVFNALMKKICK